jgi:hypothetical protein
MQQCPAVAGTVELRRWNLPAALQGLLHAGVAHRPDKQLRPWWCLPVRHRECPVPPLTPQMQYPIRMVAAPA